MASAEFHAMQERMASQPPPDPNLTLPQRRAGIDATLGAVPLAPGTTATAFDVGGVPVIECTPEGAEPHAVLVYAHGGGFRMGSALAYRAYGSHLAAVSGARVVLVDYRLAPEHPFPAALDDLLAVVRALVGAGVDSGRIVLGGDSAGGNLVAAAVLVMKEAGEPLPAGIICCSPWVDLTNSATTYTTRAEVDRMFSLQSATDAAAAYLPEGTDRRTPLVSPLFGDWAGGPPVLIQVGDAEVLLDDSAGLEEALAAAGVSVRRHVYPEMPHVWQLSYPAYPEAVAAVEELAAFVGEVTGS